MKRIQNSLIVSCQALEDEPPHSSLIMSKMALAAKMGGAKGIRANSVQDIHEIKKEVDLPIIGIIKKDYEDTDIYITTTMKEVDALVAEGVDIIAMDATMQLRPHNQTITEFFKEVKAKYPHQLFMADCSTVEEAIHADNIGFDFIGTTLVGYTPQSQNSRIDANDFKIIREIVKNVKHPVIGEGNIDPFCQLGSQCLSAFAESDDNDIILFHTSISLIGSILFLHCQTVRQWHRQEWPYP